MVDRIREKKFWNKKRIWTISGIAGIIILILASFYFTSGKSKLNVEAERITISEVTQGPFQEFIPVNGVVLPITTIYLDALEGGRVEEKFGKSSHSPHSLSFVVFVLWYPTLLLSSLVLLVCCHLD